MVGEPALGGRRESARQYHPAGVWRLNDRPQQCVLTGSKPEDVPGLLKANVWPLLAEQSSPDLLGGATVKAIADTAGFLAEQKKIPAVLPDYSAYVNKAFAAQALTKLSSQ